MRLPWRRRPKSGRVVFIGTSPFDVADVISAKPAPEPAAGIQFGFTDGTVLTLAHDDPRAVTLREAAARLTGTG